MRKLTGLAAALLILCLLSACGGAHTGDDGGGSVFTTARLEGGSGKASVLSPVELRPEGDGYIAVICWTSPYYDYMIAGGETYYPVNTGGNSVFEIPVESAECVVELQADTTAMGTPHLIDYTLVLGGEESSGGSAEAAVETESDGELRLHKTGSMELLYAGQFTVDYYEGGLSLITIAGNARYLLIPEGGQVPDALPADITVLKQPLENIYLVSSSAMDMFAACGAMDCLGFCALDRGGWYIPEAVSAIDSGALVYAGKYSAPDYELLRSGGCGLAVENMMISHSPEVVEELEGLGIPVIIERSSYESTPPGRMEWIKLYGLLTGHSEEAEAAFNEQLAVFSALDGIEKSGLTAAVFYVTASGTVSVRNGSDYLAAMLELAGGSYAFEGIGTGSGNATTNIQMEEFYATAKEADFLIYNGTVSGGPDSLDEFLSLSPLFGSMRAVTEGHVYAMAANLYQSSMELGDITLDLYNMFSGNDSQLRFLTKLE